MLDVKVTVQVGSRKVTADKVSDPRIGRTLSQAGRDIGQKLAAVACPEHRKGPTNVRVHFDKSGAADLAYDSCCERLGPLVSAALG